MVAAINENRQPVKISTQTRDATKDYKQYCNEMKYGGFKFQVQH